MRRSPTSGSAAIAFLLLTACGDGGGATADGGSDGGDANRVRVIIDAKRAKIGYDVKVYFCPQERFAGDPYTRCEYEGSAFDSSSGALEAEVWITVPSGTPTIGVAVVGDDGSLDNRPCIEWNLQLPMGGDPVKITADMEGSSFYQGCQPAEACANVDNGCQNYPGAR